MVCIVPRVERNNWLLSPDLQPRDNHFPSAPQQHSGAGCACRSVCLVSDLPGTGPIWDGYRPRGLFAKRPVCSGCHKKERSPVKLIVFKTFAMGKQFISTKPWTRFPASCSEAAEAFGSVGARDSAPAGGGAQAGGSSACGGLGHQKIPSQS